MCLACQNPLSKTFSTWKQAKSYYNVCFKDGSVIIRTLLQNQTPTQSLVRKKCKVNLKHLEHKPLAQPPFSSAFSTPKAKGSASQLINISSTKSTPASHSMHAYMPLLFPELLSIISKPANSWKHPHAGFQTHNSTSCPREYPESTRVLANPHNTPNVASPSPKLWILGEESLTPSPPYAMCSLGHIDPCYVYVDSSSDEGTATDSNDNCAATTRPGPSSSLIVEVHSNAPTTHHISSPIIIILDSEEEEAECELMWHKSTWPNPTDHNSISKINELLGLPGLSPWNAQPCTPVVCNLVCH